MLAPVNFTSLLVLWSSRDPERPASTNKQLNMAKCRSPRVIKRLTQVRKHFVTLKWAPKPIHYSDWWKILLSNWAPGHLQATICEFLKRNKSFYWAETNRKQMRHRQVRQEGGGLWGPPPLGPWRWVSATGTQTCDGTFYPNNKMMDLFWSISSDLSRK